MSNFFENYKRPEWQKKAAEIRERAGYECEWCGDNKSQLDVHHSYYEKDAMPWEYPSESLHCLCKKCHKEQQELKKKINRQFGRMSLTEMERLLGYMIGCEIEVHNDITFELPNHPIALGVAQYWGLDDIKVVRKYIDHGYVNGIMLDQMVHEQDEQDRKQLFPRDVFEPCDLAVSG